MFDNSPIWEYNKDKTKLEFKTGHDILQSYNTLFSNIFENINLNPDTPQGQLISADAQRDMEIINSIEDICNYFFNGGNGLMLDMWAWNLFRATRKESVDGYVNIEINGVPNTTINAGFIVSDGNLQYELRTNITIDSKGNANAIFYNKKNTLDISKANTITQIITPLLNVERVNNPSDSIPTIPKESDTAFYIRCINYGSLYPNGSFASIMANIYQIEGVNKVNGYENKTNEEITYKGVKFPPHSIGIVISGGDKQKIGKVISETKPVGTDIVGNVEVEVKDPFGRLIIYKYYTPTLVPLKFDINIKSDVTSPKNYKEQITQALNYFINNLPIGAYITQPEVSKAIENYITGFIVVDVKISKKSDTPNYNAIELNFAELASVSPEDISVGTI